MDIDAELARFKPSRALREWVGGTVRNLLDQAALDKEIIQQRDLQAALDKEIIQQRDLQAARDKEIIRQRDLKIQVLALELAHHKRIRFGKKNESLTAAQRDLFEETWESDLGAIQAEHGGADHASAAARSPPPCWPPASARAPAAHRAPA